MWGLKAPRRLTPKVMIETPVSTLMAFTRNVGSGMMGSSHSPEARRMKSRGGEEG